MNDNEVMCGITRNEVLFGTLNPDGVVSNVRSIKQATMLKCPHYIMHPEHYREDGTCKCNDGDNSHMKEWGYVWNDVTSMWDCPEEEEE